MFFAPTFWYPFAIMTDPLVIRTALATDVGPLLALYTHLDPDAETSDLATAQASFDRFLRYDGSAIFLGEQGGALVTSCALVVIPNLTRRCAPYALIENVVTHAAHRGKGHGIKVLEAACDRAWQSGCYKVMLMTGSTRPSVLAFYERAGFAQTKTGFQKRRVPPRKE